MSNAPATRGGGGPPMSRGGNGPNPASGIVNPHGVPVNPPPNPMETIGPTLQTVLELIQKHEYFLAEVSDRQLALIETFRTMDQFEAYKEILLEIKGRRNLITQLRVENAQLFDVIKKVRDWNEGRENLRIDHSSFQPEWLAELLRGEGTVSNKIRKEFALEMGLRKEVAEQWFGEKTDTDTEDVETDEGQ